MLPSNVGHQHNSQNNFKTTGFIHSVIMLIYNSPTGKAGMLHIETQFQALTGSVETLSVLKLIASYIYCFWQGMHTSFISVGKTLVIIVCLIFYFEYFSSPKSHKGWKRMRPKFKLDYCLPWVALPIWWNPSLLHIHALALFKIWV